MMTSNIGICNILRQEAQNYQKKNPYYIENTKNLEIAQPWLIQLWKKVATENIYKLINLETVEIYLRSLPKSNNEKHPISNFLTDFWNSLTEYRKNIRSIY